ncbi:MAG: endo alpha-1,4 polygalactosaminidase [Alphaproteobacteria bacterium]|nr:endo alpha-1,4 polygalactosaminidase [Alphaproteobacteria bacterium]
MTFSVTTAFASGAAPERAPSSIPWAVYYGDGSDSQSLAPFKVVVLDETTTMPIKSLHSTGKVMLLYVNLGEAETHRDYFDSLKSRNLTLGENPNWPGSYSIDLRSGDWAEHIIEEIIPAALHHGFQGVFLDTVDNAAELERTQPVQNAGMKDAAIRVVRAMRENYPSLIIMQNRGYDVLPQTAPYIDMVLGESIYATYNFATKQYEHVAADLYKQQVEILKGAQRINPKLQIFTLDYAAPENKDEIRAIYAEERKNGFNPYVATIKLDQIIPEPLQ